MDVRALKDKATQLFSKGKFVKAAEAYDEYCKADPKDLVARLRTGDAWNKAGQKDKAVAAYISAAEGFAKDGFLPRAIAASKLVLELQPRHMHVQMMLADLYAQKKAPPSKSNLPVSRNPAPAAPSAPPPVTRVTKAGSAADLPPPAVARPTPAAEPALTRPDAIELVVEDEGTKDGPPPAPPAEIEIEVAPLQGEVEIPLDGPLPDADQLPAELQVPVVAGTDIAPTPPPMVSGAALDPEVRASAPSVKVYDLSDEEPELPLELGPPRIAPLIAPVIAPVADTSNAPPPRLPLPLPLPLDGDGLVGASGLPAVVVPPQPPEVIPPLGRVTSEGGPPGLKSKRGEAPPASEAPSAPEAPPFQSSPSASRIWLPPRFDADGAGSAEPTAFTKPRSPGAPASGGSDLERSLQAFAQFDAPPVVAAPSHSFTELELEDDTLLHAVDAAAQRGLSQRGGAGRSAEPVEEAMEAPDDAKAEPGALPKIPLFSDLPVDAFIALFEQCPLRRFEPGDPVVQQGSKGDAFYVICAGGVRVVRTEGGQQLELAKLEEGAFFGEMALLSEAPRSASVLATEEDTQLLEIGAAVLKDLSAKYPAVSTALKKFCRQRLLSNLMQGSALFKPFSKSDRRELVQRFRAREVRKGEALIREGQTSDGLYVVLSGEVEVSVKGRRVAGLKEGELFGEMSLLTRSPAAATVSAARHTSLLRLPREDFERLILSHPQVLAHVSELTDERAKANAAAEMI